MTNLGNFKLKEFADDNFKFDKNQGKFSKRVENSVGKGELLIYPLLYNPNLMTLRKKTSENIVGKGENAGNQHFLLFSQCFIPFQNQISIFDSLLFCHLEILLISRSLKFCCLLTISKTTNFRLLQSERLCRQQFHLQ